jgi:membrane protease YdiL (CAAX protease family)
MAMDAHSARRDGTVHSFDLVIAFFGGNAAGALLGLVALAVVLGVAMAQGFRPTPEAIELALNSNFAVFQIMLAAGEIGLVGMVYLVAGWRFERPLAHFFAPAAILTVALAALSGAVLSAVMNLGNAFLQSAHWIDIRETSIDKLMVPHGPQQYAIALTVIAGLAPFAEEYFFRGLLFIWLRKRWSLSIAVLATSLVFALVHGQPMMHPGLGGWVMTVELFVAGLLLAFWVAHTGSLRTSFAAHAAFNAVALALPLFLP